MARSNDSYRLGYGASTYTPDSGRSPINFGSVGNAVRDFSSPGRSFGSGVGVTVSTPIQYKKKAKGGAIKAKKMAAGGSASKRADGCAQRGKTKGKFV